MTVDVERNLARVKENIAQAAKQVGRAPEDIQLVAVSKYASVEAVSQLAAAGHLDFGESRVQDGLAKVEAIDRPLSWHLIGRIQTNKVKYLSPFSLVHSLDRWNLAKKMSQYAVKNDFRFKCLVQVNVADDPAKAGVQLNDVDKFLEKLTGLDGLQIRGLMTITALDAGPVQTRAWFEALAAKFNDLSQKWRSDKIQMDLLSMGMSADYPLAIAAGANIVRVGSAIFAEEGK